MTKRDAYRDSRDKAGLTGTCPAGQTVAEPGRTGTALFRGCPVVPPCDAPMIGLGQFDHNRGTKTVNHLICACSKMNSDIQGKRLTPGFVTYNGAEAMCGMNAGRLNVRQLNAIVVTHGLCVLNVKEEDRHRCIMSATFGARYNLPQALRLADTGGSLSGRAARGGGEPRYFNLHSKIGMEPRGACRDALPLSGQAGGGFDAPEGSWGLLR